MRCLIGFRRGRLLAPSWLLMCALAWAGPSTGAEIFERRCERSLPQPFIEIDVRIGAPAISHDRPLSEIARDGEDAAVAREAAYSRSKVSWTGHVGLNGFENGDDTVCASPSFVVDLTLETEVVIAREVFAEPCLAELALGHELEHMRIAEGNLKAAADQLEQDLREAYASRPLVGRERELLKDLNREIEERWKPRLWALIDEGDGRHRALDERDKAKTLSACGGRLARMLGHRNGVNKQ